MVTGGQCLAGLSIVVPAEGDRQAVALSQPTGFEHQTALALFLCACLTCVPGVCTIRHSRGGELNTQVCVLEEGTQLELY